jgi:hypothetical protein
MASGYVSGEATARTDGLLIARASMRFHATAARTSAVAPPRTASAGSRSSAAPKSAASALCGHEGIDGVAQVPRSNLRASPWSRPEPSGRRKKQYKPGEYVSIPRAGDDRAGYVIGIGLDTAAWEAQGMLPDPRVVEQRILDLPDEEARAAGEAAVACADYWGRLGWHLHGRHGPGAGRCDAACGAARTDGTMRAVRRARIGTRSRASSVARPAMTTGSASSAFVVTEPRPRKRLAVAPMPAAWYPRIAAAARCASSAGSGLKCRPHRSGDSGRVAPPHSNRSITVS